MAFDKEIEEALEENTPLPSFEKSGWETDAPAQRAVPDEEEPTPLPPTGLNIGHLRDRAAAALFDILLLGYLYAGGALVYNFIVWRELLRPLPWSGNHGFIFHLLFGLLFFLYFFIQEGVFFTTIGKLFARLSVRDTMGRPAGLLAVAVRNLLRPIDLLLAGLPLWFLLEKFPHQQRLGDLAAGTVVMKHFKRAPKRLPVAGYTASASLRLIAGMIDLCFALFWIGGVVLFVDDAEPLFSLMVLAAVPVFYLIWHLVWEGMLQTSPGLWIFGLKIVGEDGSPIGFTQGFLRALFRLFDSNPFGWATLFLSSKNQRPSDLAAATVVVHAKRAWNIFIALGVSLGLMGGIWIAGLTNPHNFLTPFFKLDFLKSAFTVRVGGMEQTPEARGRGLFIKNLTFLEDDRTTPREETIFKPGQRIFFSFDATGFTVRDNEAWVQEDLTVRYPNHSIGFKQETIVDFHQRLKKPDQPLEIVNTLILPADAKPGYYTLVISLHDKLSDQHLTEQRSFRVAP
ncbi:MAG: RDD family protein [Deltaproteobacteria bacterium]|nr:RDD family protein [Deltaproteobacteria bacterium]